MIDKRVASVAAALAGLTDGMTLLVGGFGEAGVPTTLLDGVLERGVSDLTIVSNNAGTGEGGLGALLRERRVRKIICSYPSSSGSKWFEERYAQKQLELELVPQGTLSERMRCAGAGLGGFLTAVGVGTVLAAERPVMEVDGRTLLLERPLRGDFALIAADRGDRWGNLTYRKSTRNFGPVMATAAAVTVAEIRHCAGLGELDPETIVTPGIFVDRLLTVNAQR